MSNVKKEKQWHNKKLPTKEINEQMLENCIVQVYNNSLQNLNMTKD